MSILRIHKKQNNFVILDKSCLNDTKLSMAAKGLHAYLISMPDDWKVRVDHLQTMFRNGRDAIRAALSELEKHGYIEKSSCRNEENGRFHGMEYLVYETSNFHEPEKNPLPEKASPVQNGENPVPENPGPGNPLTEKATLINNKDTKYQEINNKAAAETNVFSEEAQSELPEENLAAAPFFENQENTKNQTADIRPFQTPSKRDALIGEILTANQQSRIRMLAESLTGADPFCFPTTNQFEAEITFCMKSKNHFKACGMDFNYKFNAIKAVISRGDWQSPAELVYETVSTEDQKINQLQQDLNAAIAEARHFEKLMNSASTSARPGIAEIVTKAKEKVATLQQVLQQINHIRQA